MKKFLLGIVGLVALGLAPASAADLAARPYTKAPPMIAAIYDWTGFYIGANAGYGSSRKSWDYLGPLAVGAEGSHDATGALAGGQIGYNWQTGAWMFGLDAQGDWADLSGSNLSTRFAGTSNRSRIDGLGLFTGRLGYAWNTAMLYVKGGAAVVTDRYDFRPVGGAIVGSASETRWGGAVGVGLEYGFTPNWSVAVEYNHAFLGRNDVTFNTGDRDSIRQDLDMVTARINYRWGGPVVGRY